MSRGLREVGEFLHIIVRGIGRQILFENDNDRKRYLSLLEKYKEENEISLLAYCLMDNHVHLLVQDSNRNISMFMKQMGVSYAHYYNQKYERVGHLFQDRYKSEVVDSDKYLLTVFRYILNNPVKAGICDASMYPWSSYKEYLRQNGLTDKTLLHSLIGNTRYRLNRFLGQADYDEIDCMDVDQTGFNEERALQVLRRVLQVESGTQLQQYERKQRNDALRELKKHGLSVRQIERLTGINRGVVQRA